MVSIIIPSFNRFNSLLCSIESCLLQTSIKNSQDFEIIIINDCSTQKEYYEFDFEKLGIKIIHSKKNSKDIFGFVNVGYIRNLGIFESKYDYIAFLDDDDIWLPNKLEIQLKKMKEEKVLFSCTDGLIGYDSYNENKIYPKFNKEYHFNQIKSIYNKRGIDFKDFPDIFDFDFINIHNCIITSSVIIHKLIFPMFENLVIGQEDWTCWKNILKQNKCLYIKDILFYYKNK